MLIENLTGDQFLARFIYLCRQGLIYQLGADAARPPPFYSWGTRSAHWKPQSRIFDEY